MAAFPVITQEISLLSINIDQSIVKGECYQSSRQNAT